MEDEAITLGGVAQPGVAAWETWVPQYSSFHGYSMRNEGSLRICTFLDTLYVSNHQSTTLFPITCNGLFMLAI